MVAKDGNSCSLSLEKVSFQDMSKDTEIEEEKVKEIVNEMVAITLIDKERYNNGKVIYIPQFVNYYDDYSKRVRRMFGDDTKNVAENRRDYSRLEENIIDIWNKSLLPKIYSFSKDRKKHLLWCSKNKHFLENYAVAIEKIANSKFCLGENDRGWKATIDWFLANDTNYLKALEGKYDNRLDDVEDIKGAIKRDT